MAKRVERTGRTKKTTRKRVHRNKDKKGDEGGSTSDMSLAQTPRSRTARAPVVSARRPTARAPAVSARRPAKRKAPNAKARAVKSARATRAEDHAEANAKAGAGCNATAATPLASDRASLTVECESCGVVYHGPKLYTQGQFERTFVRDAAEHRAGSAFPETAADTTASIMLTACGCGSSVIVCLPCLVAHIRTSRSSTSACMDCSRQFGNDIAHAMLSFETGHLCRSDEHVMAQLAVRSAMQSANTRTVCPCHGTPMVRKEFYFVPDADAAASAQLKRGPETGGSKATITHAPLCASCLQPCSLVDKCECTQPEYQENPFFRRADGACRLARNNEITPADAVGFIQRLWDMPTGPVECVCGTMVYRTVDCHETACHCGFHVCFACGYAGFDTGVGSTLSHHYYGAGACPMFPLEFRVRAKGKHLTERYPCRSFDGMYMATKNGPVCHGYNFDCTDPTHRPWLDVYDGNRRAAQGEGFVRHLKGTAAYAAAAKALASQPEMALYGTPATAAI